VGVPRYLLRNQGRPAGFTLIKMGYATRYTLEVRDPVSNYLLEDERFLGLIIADLRGSNGEAKYALQANGLASGDDSRWYEHQEDMTEFSKKYPTFLFVLNGEGEESGDIWREYFLNGKSQHEKATLQIPPFDRTKLQ
jgi:hypothetical protein